jgi:sugar lactone lactonase YvrE
MGSAYAQTVLPGPGIINTVAGDGPTDVFPNPALRGGIWGYDFGDGGTAISAGLNNPSAVALDAARNIYIAEGNNPDATGGDRVRMVTASTGIITTVAGTGKYGFSGDGGPATSAELNIPLGVAVDGVGNIYIADALNSRIREVAASTGIITTVAGSGSVAVHKGSSHPIGPCAYSGDGGPATSAVLCDPGGIAVDSAGNIYFADDGNYVIRKVTASTGIITTVAGNGTPGFSGDGGLAASAQLEPGGVALDSYGNIYIADSGNNRIRMVTASTGIINTIAGNGTAGFSGDGGAATIAELNGAPGVALDGSGNIYVVDTYNNRIRVISASTGIITTFVGNGKGSYSGDGLAATNADLYNPEGVGTDSAGNVYIADSWNNRVRTVGAYPISILYPAYQVTSIIYAPPGNKSSAGFTDTTTDGTTTTLGGSFQDANTITFTEGWSFLGAGGSISESFGVSHTKTNMSAFTETYTDAEAVSLANNASGLNAINHNNDLFLIWLNPQINITLNGSTPASYSLGIRPSANEDSAEPDILEIFAQSMEANSSGNSTVPIQYLEQQQYPSAIPGAPQTIAPGLAAICQNQTYYPNNCSGDPNGQCGCKPSDFAPILALDPLLNYSGTTSPLVADISGASACDFNATSADNCRYVPVPVAPGSTEQQLLTLEGPQYSGGPDSCNSLVQTEQTSTTQTYGGTTAESVGFSFKAGSPVFSVTEANTLTWTQLQSTGTTTGSGSSMNLNLCSATVGCDQNIAIYEDTEYHTFAFQQPTGNNSCP